MKIGYFQQRTLMTSESSCFLLYPLYIFIIDKPAVCQVGKIYFRDKSWPILQKNKKKERKKVTRGQTQVAASDTALSAITTTGAMIHGRTHLGMSWWAINHQCCKTSVCAKTKPALCLGACWSLGVSVLMWRGVVEQGLKRMCLNAVDHYLNLYPRIPFVDPSMA